MSDVKRFIPAYDSKYPEMNLDQKNGPYVRYTDYAALAAERDAARAECERLKGAVSLLESLSADVICERGKASAELTRLSSKLDEAVGLLRRWIHCESVGASIVIDNATRQFLRTIDAEAATKETRG
jgi:hypothetical protein